MQCCASLNCSTEASSTIKALDQALFSTIITLVNDSERLFNKKWLRPVTNQSNHPSGWKAKPNTFLHSVLLDPFHMSTTNIHRHSKNRIWKYCVHGSSRKLIIILVAILEYRAKHLSSWIASACKRLGERLRSEENHWIALGVLALLNTLQVYQLVNFSSDCTVDEQTSLDLVWSHTHTENRGCHDMVSIVYWAKSTSQLRPCQFSCIKLKYLCPFRMTKD